MPKFFLAPEDTAGKTLVLTGEQYNHAKVLRLRSGDEVTVCDGCGTDFLCTVADCADGQLVLVMVNPTDDQITTNIRLNDQITGAKMPPHSIATVLF